MKTSAIIEARMGSNRLPGKVLMEAAKKPMLEHLVNRLRKVKSIDGIILATTENKKDDVLIDFAIKNKIKYFRGSEEDVLSRVLNAGKYYKVEKVVSITGDCPIIDPNIIEQVIRLYRIHKVSFVTNALVRLIRIRPDLKNSYQNIVQGTLEEIFQNYLSIGGILLHGSWGRVRKSWNIGGFPQQDIMPYGNNWVVEVLYRLLNSDWKIYKTI